MVEQLERMAVELEPAELLAVELGQLVELLELSGLERMELAVQLERLAEQGQIVPEQIVPEQQAVQPAQGPPACRGSSDA